MCGICGAFRLDGDPSAPLAEPVLRTMTHIIEHRGPDDAGFVEGDGCSLGARRLSIIDVAGGHQPLSNESGRIWAAQNGEIYNHRQLRERLQARGHVLRSHCDTEVLPHLYEDYGDDLVDHLRGMWAIAVWDREARRGVIARDRLGVKPLYYARVGDIVVFGSELKCLAASGLVTPEIDPEAIAAYLMLGYVPGPLSPLKDVRKLMPGEKLVVEDGDMRLERYWRHPAPNPDPSDRSAEDWAEEVRATLEESVKMRLMSDVPLGAMLSGGLDSSLIVALMARHTSGPVQTFAVGFSGEDSELEDARRVAEACGAEHHALEVTLATTQEELSRLVWHLDEPLADLSSVGFLALCRLAREHVTVALSGQGADELFAGYRKHRVAALSERWGAVPAALRSAAAAAAQKGPEKGRHLMSALESSDPVSRLLASTGYVHPDLQGELFSGALAEHADAARRIVDDRLDGARNRAPLESALYLDARLGLVDDMLHYFDRASMATSLEVRVPFLDHEFVELCARIPTRHKVRGRAGTEILQAKHVLRLAAKGLVPDFVLTKRKRAFFSDSVTTWLNAEDGALVDRLLLGPDPAYAAVVDPDAVARAVREYRAGVVGHRKLLLALVVLELWLGEWVERAFSHAPSGVVAAGGR